ncbi:MAG: PAS domain-containing protein [Acidimicrobiales bacterium]
MEAVADALALADANGGILYWNPSASRRFGWTSAEPVGRVVTEVVRRVGDLVPGRVGVQVVPATPPRRGEDVIGTPPYEMHGQSGSVDPREMGGLGVALAANVVVDRDAQRELARPSDPSLAETGERCVVRGSHDIGLGRKRRLVALKRRK